ncbi:MAG: hypothetical protein GX416_05645 [Bacteroidales bacterium]|nr:hypothetical protein [Bacteroidales bacterium]
MNFKILPFRQAIHIPLVIVGKVKIRDLSGQIDFQCPIRFGLLLIGKDVDNMPISFLPTQILIQGTLIIEGACIINQSANVIVWTHGILKLGEGILICSGVTVKAVNFVAIGKYSMISSGSFIMDSNIHCIRDTETGETYNPTSKIQIGSYCWLSMYATVLGGEDYQTAV